MKLNFSINRIPARNKDFKRTNFNGKTTFSEKVFSQSTTKLLNQESSFPRNLKS